MRKIVLLMILGGLLLVTAGCGNGRSNVSPSGGLNNANASISVDASVDKVVKEYFNAYFDAEKTLNYSKIGDTILADTENMQLNESFRKTELARKDFFGEQISYYQYKINYKKCSTNGDEVTVALTLDLNFHYSDAPSDLDSAIAGVNYSFTLKNNGSNLVITQIDSDLEEFVAFKDQVQEMIKQNSALSKTAAIEQVSKNRENQLQIMKSSKTLYSKGASVVTSATPNATTSKILSTDTATNSLINKSIYVSCRQYSYQPECAAAYAAAYWNGNSPFITYNNADCTNFVSQCVWAGYVGWGNTVNASNVASYISKKAGMLFPDWFATKTDNSDSWTTVTEFFDYMLTSKEVGPKGTTDYKDYDKKREYTTIPASSINVGDVIQIWYDNNYGHSIIITRKTSNDYSGLYYSSHTNNRYNEKFSTATSSSKYMRRLTPAATCYLKTY